MYHESKSINKELKLYNYDYKKIKLPSNLYSQLLVHNVASTFSGKRRDQYGEFFSQLKIVALLLWPLTLVVRGCGCVVTILALDIS